MPVVVALAVVLPAAITEAVGQEGRTTADEAAPQGEGAQSGEANGEPSPGPLGERRRAAPDGAAEPPASFLPAEEVTGGLSIPGEASLGGAAANAGALAGRMSVQPPRAQTPPSIDGRLDDAVWRDAARVTDFVQRQPLDGAPATERTDVYIAYDSSTLYLGFHAHYEDPGMMRANRSDRDRAGFSDDIFSVYFDPFLDQQRAYVFSVNGYGVQDDAILGSRGGGGGFGGGGFRGGGFGGGLPRGDSSWDALFSSGGQIVEDGFTAEMAIPFKSLRYPSRGGDIPHTWGFQIARSIRGKDETIVWSPVSRDISGFLPQMGVLTGITGLSTSRNLEMQPTLTGVQFGTLDEAAGRVVDGDPQPEAGLNVKYGVTSNVTADLTFNPDFSQIESDRPQVEVNQRFALFFPELRPFFLEGAEIFQVTAPVTVVHTRTIVDPLYGAKLTGKVGDTTVGVLYANDDAAGDLDDLTDPAFGKSAQTFVGRVRYDLYAESFIGAIFTDREFLEASSRLVGVDGNFRLGDTHSLGFRALGTDHRNDDGLETSGYLLDTNFRSSGRNLNYDGSVSVLSPDFRTDVGFVRRTDQRRFSGGVGYKWWPEGWLISWGPDARYYRSHNFDGVLEDEEISVGTDFDFAKSIRVGVNVNRDMERFGGIDFHKTRVRFHGNIETSAILKASGGFGRGDEVYFDSVNPFLGSESSMFISLNFRPLSRLHSRVSINTSRFTDPHGRFLPGVNTGAVDENGLVFNVNIFRVMTTYQFSDRLLFRNISEVNTFDQTLRLNFLLTYRVNSGTAIFVGYDDQYQQREQFDDPELYPGTGYQQTNRAIFAKFQYLFRF